VTEHVTIIGGGIYGASLAWRLAGAQIPVTIIEADIPAAGASGGPGHRGVRGSGRDLAELALMESAYRIWERLADELGTDIGYERIGSLRVYDEEVTGTSGGWLSAPARVAVQQAFGVPSRLVPPDELRESFPFISPTAIGAVHAPLDGTVDHTVTTRAFATAAQARGAELVSGSRVAELIVDDGSVTGLALDNGDRIAVPGTVALLANTDASRLVTAACSRDLPFWPIRPQMILARYAEAVQLPSLVSHDARRVSIKSVADGRVMISGGWPGTTTADHVALDDLPAYAAANFAEAVAVIPALADPVDFDLDATRVESTSIDGMPVIDRLPGIHNALVGAGWTGHGFAISVEITRLLAQWIQSGDRPAALARFTIERFGAS
jgi:sarcosine oxidase subunit beta